MSEVRYVLLGDGRSDRALMPILTWLLRLHFPDTALQGDWADLTRLRQPPKKLEDRIRTSLDLYPCDLLFVHRDAEKESYEQRLAEIRDALAKAALPQKLPTIGVIPVRMTEAWLLIHEGALRRAAGNPNGKETLPMPAISDLETLIDPKATLYQLLEQASGLSGRRRKEFRSGDRVHRLAALIEDFSPLHHLAAFQRLEQEVHRLATHFGQSRG
jgi:hypothetical protein